LHAEETEKSIFDGQYRVLAVEGDRLLVEEFSAAKC
jgi:hypothetical protein